MGTRNYIGVLPSVNCAATVARLAATAAAPRLAGVPSCDGVIALAHDLGRGMAKGTPEDDILRRTLRGYATHPNLAAVVVVTLGCEVNQPENFLSRSAAHVEHLSTQRAQGPAFPRRKLRAWPASGSVFEVERVDPGTVDERLPRRPLDLTDA